MSAAKIDTETFKALRERIPQELLRQRQQGKNTLSYISWYDACELLDQRAPGWSMEIKQVGEMGGKVFVRVALTIDGVTRENIGCEDEELKGYGDVFSNSVGMALRRAAALFGLGRHLYDKTDRGGTGNRYPQQANSNVSPMPYQNAPKAVEAKRNWHEEIGDLWKRLRALGIATFKDGDAMMVHFKTIAKQKQWADSLQDLERISNAPEPIARTYAGILADLYAVEKARL